MNSNLERLIKTTLNHINTDLTLYSWTVHLFLLRTMFYNNFTGIVLFFVSYFWIYCSFYEKSGAVCYCYKNSGCNNLIKSLISMVQVQKYSYFPGVMTLRLITGIRRDWTILCNWLIAVWIFFIPSSNSMRDGNFLSSSGFVNMASDIFQQKAEKVRLIVCDWTGHNRWLSNGFYI